jgi:hypothetical protein
MARHDLGSQGLGYARINARLTVDAPIQRRAT